MPSSSPKAEHRVKVGGHWKGLWSTNNTCHEARGSVMMPLNEDVHVAGLAAEILLILQSFSFLSSIFGLVSNILI